MTDIFRFTPDTPNRLSSGYVAQEGINRQVMHGDSRFVDPHAHVGKILSVLTYDMPKNQSKTHMEADVLGENGLVYRNCEIAAPVATRGKYANHDPMPWQPEEPLASPYAKSYDEIEGERVLFLCVDGNIRRPVVIASLNFQSSAVPIKPHGPTLKSGPVTRTMDKGISQFIDNEGVFNLVAAETTAEGGIPDPEGLAETSNAIRIMKGKSALYLDKEGDIHVQHKTGSLFQIATSAVNEDKAMFVMKGAGADGFALVIDEGKNVLQFSLGTFTAIIDPNTGTFLLGDFSDGFAGIVFQGGVGYIVAPIALIANSSMFWAATSTSYLGTQSITELKPAAWATEGSDAAIASQTVFIQE